MKIIKTELPLRITCYQGDARGEIEGTLTIRIGYDTPEEGIKLLADIEKMLTWETDITVLPSDILTRTL